jgi:hypothetical protein
MGEGIIFFQFFDIKNLEKNSKKLVKSHIKILPIFFRSKKQKNPHPIKTSLELWKSPCQAKKRILSSWILIFLFFWRCFNGMGFNFNPNNA